MKTSRVMGLMAALLLLACCPALAQSQSGAAPEEDRDLGGWYCPFCGGYMGPGGEYGYGIGPGRMRGRGYGRGPGMMRGYGQGMGLGMMDRGYGYGRGYYEEPGYGYGPRYRMPSKRLDQKQAKAEVQHHLSMMRNPNLRIGNIIDKGNDYEIEIVTKNGSLVDKILVDKDTGWMQSAY